MAEPNLSGPITLRIPQDVLADIEKIAAASDRTRSWVMVRALRLYLAGEGREILDVAGGIEELAADKGEDMDDVIADIEKIVRGNAA